MNPRRNHPSFPYWDSIVTDIVHQADILTAGNFRLTSVFLPGEGWKWAISCTNGRIGYPRRRLAANRVRVNINQNYTIQAGVHGLCTGSTLIGAFGAPVDYFDVDVNNPQSIADMAMIIAKVAPFR
jgi:hypothetical protein